MLQFKFLKSIWSIFIDVVFLLTLKMTFGKNATKMLKLEKSQFVLTVNSLVSVSWFDCFSSINNMTITIQILGPSKIANRGHYRHFTLFYIKFLAKNWMLQIVYLNSDVLQSRFVPSFSSARCGSIYFLPENREKLARSNYNSPRWIGQVASLNYLQSP